MKAGKGGGEQAAGPVSWRVNATRLPRRGMPVTITADEEQRNALAEGHDLVSVERFGAELVVSPWKRDGVRVAGRVTARIVQACTVTLDPLTADIDEPVAALFVPRNSRLAPAEEADGEILIDAEGPDAPELFEGDTIDVGALAEEIFELAIDPYPRKPGTRLEEESGDPSTPAEPGPLYESLKKFYSGN